MIPLIIVAVIALIGVASPLAIDSMDVQPDHPLYAIEKIGEEMNLALTPDKIAFKESLVQERINEFEYMAVRNKIEPTLLSDARARLTEITPSNEFDTDKFNYTDIELLEAKINESIQKLEAIKLEGVPQEAYPQIDNTIQELEEAKAKLEIIPTIDLKPLPDSEAKCLCVQTYKPVCGSNEVTYGNACLAKCSNALIAYEGKCRTEPIPLNKCGDVTGDGVINQKDIDFLTAYLYEGGPKPDLMKANVNGDSQVDVADIVYLINYLYKNGSIPKCVSTSITVKAV